MPKDSSININDFTGIYKAMAEKANINGGKTLDSTEISIFNEILSTYDPQNNIFIVENKLYDSNGNAIDHIPMKKAEAVSTRVYIKKDINDIQAEIKNYETTEAAKKAAKEIEELQNKPVRVVRYVDGKKVTFTYKRSALENYIIQYSTKKEGNENARFSKIPDIRSKSIAFRTKEESRLLLEFNNMVNSVIKAGCDYGVDPKFILAIIQKEVKFNGLDKSVNGSNGKGYMQLTSIVIADMLGAVGQKGNGEYEFQKELKTSVYGKEIKNLFKSRGFNIYCPPEKRGAVLKQIMNYLMQNNDADFNIRIGTLLLRQNLKKSGGNIKKAAQSYNTVFDLYGDSVAKIYNKICKAV